MGELNMGKIQHIESSLSINCKKCGKCCTDTFSVDFTHSITEDERLLLKWKGWKVDGNTISITTRCKHLSNENMCLIYENRPQKCKDYHCKEVNL